MAHHGVLRRPRNANCAARGIPARGNLRRGGDTSQSPSVVNAVLERQGQARAAKPRSQTSDRRTPRYRKCHVARFDAPMPPEPQPRHGLKARPKLRARPAAPDGPGPAIRQSRASRHSRPASRRDHEPEAPAFALRRVRTTACDRSDARPAFIQRQVSCPRSSAPSCSPPARLSAGPDRSSSLQSVSIPVNSQKQGAPPSDPQFGRAGLCPDSGRDLGCADLREAWARRV